MWWRSVWRTRCVRSGPCWLMKCAVWRTGPTVPYTPWWRTSTPTTLYKKWLTLPSRHSARSSCTRWTVELTTYLCFICISFPSISFHRFLCPVFAASVYSACSAFWYDCLPVLSVFRSGLILEPFGSIRMGSTFWPSWRSTTWRME